jgi:hypothetical protein
MAASSSAETSATSDAPQLADSSAETCAAWNEDPLPSNEIPLQRFAFDCVIDMGNPATWPIVYKGKEYRGIASTHPVYIPHPDFLVINPIWTQCSCMHGCFVCTYDGATLCLGCATVCTGDSSGDERGDASQLADSNAETSPCNCEPGCCGIPPDSTDSSGDEDVVLGGDLCENNSDAAGE